MHHSDRSGCLNWCSIWRTPPENWRVGNSFYQNLNSMLCIELVIGTRHLSPYRGSEELVQIPKKGMLSYQRWWCHQWSTEEGSSTMIMTGTPTYYVFVKIEMTLWKMEATHYRRRFHLLSYNRTHGDWRNFNFGRVSASTGLRSWMSSCCPNCGNFRLIISVRLPWCSGMTSTSGQRNSGVRPSHAMSMYTMFISLSNLCRAP